MKSREEEGARATILARVKDALREARATRMCEELSALQGDWRHRAKEKGILTDAELDRYLEE